MVCDEGLCEFVFEDLFVVGILVDFMFEVGGDGCEMVS